MAAPDDLRDDQVQNYIDDRLDERARAAVAAHLLAHPDAAAEVEALRRQNEALKGIGQEILDESVPERLLELLREEPKVVNLTEERGRRRPSAFLEAAAAILLFCAGGGIGWFLNDQLDQPPQAADVIASDLARWYDFYGATRDYPIDFPPDRSAELATWIGRSFERDVPPPDLSAFGYNYGGGQLLPVAGVSTGFFQFYGPDHARIAVFFWPAERPPRSIIDLGRDKNISARYWFGDGLSFAVISDEANPDLERVAEAVFAFYEAKLPPS
jgi:anti-sigma factor RsiW